MEQIRTNLYMEITFLGTGTSQGVPVVACNCEVCKSKSLYDKRLRTSVMIKTGGRTFVIDSGPDFRQQMLREDVKRLDAILFTHEHKDHTAGLDDVRAFNYVQKKAMEVFAAPRVLEALHREYAYVFAAKKYPGIPKINLHSIDNQQFKIFDIPILPIEVLHLKLPVFGFRFDKFTYITDANFISEKEMAKIVGTEVLVINALRKEKHLSHFTLAEALAVIKKVKPRRAYLTHISHMMGFHESLKKEMPENVFPAFDGLKITI